MFCYYMAANANAVFSFVSLKERKYNMSTDVTISDETTMDPR